MDSPPPGRARPPRPTSTGSRRSASSRVGRSIGGHLLTARVLSELAGRRETRTWIGLSGEDFRERLVAVFPGTDAEAEAFELSLQALGTCLPSGFPRPVTGGRTPSGRYFVVWDRVEGTPLSRVRSRGPLPAEVATRIGSDLLSELTSLHRAGFHHGDLHPGNVLLDRSGTVRLVGLRPHPFAIPESGLASGTVAARYAPPEWYADGLVSQAGDLYAAALVLAELYLGRPLLALASARTARDHQARLADRLGPMLAWEDRIPVALRPALAASLDPDWKARPSTGSELAASFPELDPDKRGARDLALSIQTSHRSRGRRLVEAARRSLAKGRLLEGATQLGQGLRDLKASGESRPDAVRGLVIEALWATFDPPLEASGPEYVRPVLEAACLLLYRTASDLGTLTLATLALSRLARFARRQGPLEELLLAPGSLRVRQLDVAELRRRLETRPFAGELQLALACLSPDPPPGVPLPTQGIPTRVRLLADLGLPVPALRELSSRLPAAEDLLPWVEAIRDLAQAALGGGVGLPGVPGADRQQPEDPEGASGSHPRVSGPFEPPRNGPAEGLLEALSEVLTPVPALGPSPPGSPLSGAEGSSRFDPGIPFLEPAQPAPLDPATGPTTDPVGSADPAGSRLALFDLVFPSPASHPPAGSPDRAGSDGSGSDPTSTPPPWGDRVPPADPSEAPMLRFASLQSDLAGGALARALEHLRGLASTGILLPEDHRRILHADLCRVLWTPLAGPPGRDPVDAWLALRELAEAAGFASLGHLAERLIVAVCRNRQDQERIRDLADRFPTSIPFLVASLERDPEGAGSAPQWCRLGWLLLGHGEPGPASAAFAAAAARSPENPEVKEGMEAAEERVARLGEAATAFLDLALPRSGRAGPVPAATLERLEEFLIRHPGYLPALERMARLSAESGEAVRAAGLHLDLGRRHLLRGETRAAAEDFRTAVELDPKRDEGLLHLAALDLPKAPPGSGIRELRAEVAARAVRSRPPPG